MLIEKRWKVPIKSWGQLNKDGPFRIMSFTTRDRQFYRCISAICQPVGHFFGFGWQSLMNYRVAAHWYTYENGQNHWFRMRIIDK